MRNYYHITESKSPLIVTYMGGSSSKSNDHYKAPCKQNSDACMFAGEQGKCSSTPGCCWCKGVSTDSSDCVRTECAQKMCSGGGCSTSGRDDQLTMFVDKVHGI